MKITVTGTGYVGLVTAVCFAERGHEVICFDIDKRKIDQLNNGEPTIFEPGLKALMRKNRKRLTFTTDASTAYKNAEVIFIGVGTPENDDGSANLNSVYEAAKQIAAYAAGECVVAIKSTVPLGTNELVKEFIEDIRGEKTKIHFASNPEFLAQGSAVRDTLYPSRIIIGSDDDYAIRKLKKLYRKFEADMLITDLKSSEMIKYASNAFLALKISYINDIANLCEILGGNIKDVSAGMGMDKRIGNQFLNAGIGYGGSCFPKDTKALYSMAQKNGYNLKTVKAAIDVNEHQRRILIDRAKKYYCSFKNLNIAILGATFKPNTDDIREAPSIYIIRELLELGAKIKIWDPEGLDKINDLYGDKVSYCGNIETALIDSDLCFILTQWDEILKLSPDDFKITMRNPIVLDGRNCLDRKRMAKNNVIYEGIGL